jgi:hypothetical protein
MVNNSTNINNIYVLSQKFSYNKLKPNSSGFRLSIGKCTRKTLKNEI